MMCQRLPVRKDKRLPALADTRVWGREKKGGDEEEEEARIRRPGDLPARRATLPKWTKKASRRPEVTASGPSFSRSTEALKATMDPPKKAAAARLPMHARGCTRRRCRPSLGARP